MNGYLKGRVMPFVFLLALLPTPARSRSREELKKIKNEYASVKSRLAKHIVYETGIVPDQAGADGRILQ